MPNQVQPGERGVVLLLVDHREGGGEARKGYWELTRELERQDVRYETRALEPGAGDLVRVRVRVRTLTLTLTLTRCGRLPARARRRSRGLAPRHGTGARAQAGAH